MSRRRASRSAGVEAHDLLNFLLHFFWSINGWSAIQQLREHATVVQSTAKASDQSPFLKNGVPDVVSPRLRLFLHPNRIHVAAVAVIAVVLALCITLLVYRTGGTQTSFPQLAYLPMLLAAPVLGWRGGLALGAIIGALLGPFMPLDVVGGVPQETGAWLLRAAVLLATGVLTGALFDAVRHLTEDGIRRDFIDARSGLPNALLAERIIADPEARSGFPSVVVVSLNASREVRSSFGNEIAEKLLAGAAERVKKVVGDDDVAFRNSINKFGILTPLTNVEPLLDKLARALADPLPVENVPMLLDATFGASRVQPDEAPAQIIRQASLAAENAHDLGTDRQIYQRTAETQLRDRVRLMADFRTALGSDQLFLAYQPKVRLSDGAVVGCEGLLRWQHPDRGLVSPGVFLPMLERAGFTLDLTAHVLDEALLAISTWSGEGIATEVSVNMSARDLSSPTLIDLTLAKVRESGIDPQLLDVEITESAAFDTGREITASLKRFRDAGISLSIDDFGTGLSSLSYLKQIPASTLKIDRSFVANLETDEQDRILVEATVGMCRRMGLKTVAEGVETEGCVFVLKTIGCDLAQGYYFAKPMASSRMAELLRNRNAKLGHTIRKSEMKDGGPEGLSSSCCVDP